MLSIVITNFNYGRFLRDAIDSALAQTYPHVEVIVVDDGSTDDSREIIRSYGDRIIPVLKENGGQASAFNAGFAASHGDIVIFLDADDMLLPNASSTLVSAWSRRIAKAEYPLEYIDESGEPLGARSTLVPLPSSDAINLLLKSFFLASPPTTANAFARSALTQILPMPEENWRLCADRYLTVSALFLGEILPLDAPLGCYRVHASHTSRIAWCDPDALRRALAVDVGTYELIRRLAPTARIRKDLLLRNWGHASTRLLSLRVDKANHPFPEDSRVWVCCRGLLACLLHSHTTIRRRLFSMLWVLTVECAPLRTVQAVHRLRHTVLARPGGLRTLRWFIGRKKR